MPKHSVKTNADPGLTRDWIELSTKEKNEVLVKLADELRHSTFETAIAEVKRNNKILRHRRDTYQTYKNARKVCRVLECNTLNKLALTVINS